MKWMEIRETCPICQRNCRHENENGNASGGERTPLLTNPLDIWEIQCRKDFCKVWVKYHKKCTYGLGQRSVFGQRVTGFDTLMLAARKTRSFTLNRVQMSLQIFLE